MEKNIERGAVSADSVVPGLVGFYFAFRLAIPILSVNLFGMDLQTGSMLKLAAGFLVFGAVCFLSFGAPARAWAWLLKPLSIRWVLFYLSFSLCSFLWSETASIPASLAYWCGTVADVATVLALFRIGNVDTGFDLQKGFVYGAGSIALIAWVMPAQDDLRLGVDNIFNANSICNVCVFAVFFAQYLMRRKQMKLVPITLLLVITIARSLSKTTIAAFLVSEAYVLIQDRTMSRQTKLLLTSFATLIILVFWGLFEAYYNVYTTTGNQAETLTGRTAIWSYAASAGADRPWIGHGFDSMWNVVPTFGTFEARHAENELLEQFYSYGIVGLGLLAGVYGSLYLDIRRRALDSVRVIFMSVLFFVVVRGFAEAEPFDLLLPLWTVTLISLLVQQDAIQAALTLHRDPNDLRVVHPVAN